MDAMNSNTGNTKVWSVKMKLKVAHYIVMCIFLSVMNYVFTPSYRWVLWVIAGWGLSLVMELISLYYTEENNERK